MFRARIIMSRHYHMDENQDTDIKLLCISDLHLGIAESDIPVPTEARMATFKRIMGLCYDHDIVLIAGDFIDGPGLAPEIMREIMVEFEGLRQAGIDVIYAPGDGELDSFGAVIAPVWDLPVTHVLTREQETSPLEMSIKGQCLYIYGMPPGDDADITTLSKVSDNGFHIGLFYVEFSAGDEDDDAQTGMNLNRIKLRKLNLDFYVFGHNHNFTMFKLHERIIGAYPGSPEPASSFEKGDRYVLSVTLKNGQLQQIRRITVNTLQYQTCEIDCTGLQSFSAVRDILEGSASSKIIMDFTITGERAFALNERELKELGEKYYRLSVTDLSIPSVELLAEQFMAEDSLRGEFFRILKNSIDSGTVPESIDRQDLARSLHRICRHGFTTMEDWLCNI